MRDQVDEQRAIGEEGPNEALGQPTRSQEAETVVGQRGSGRPSNDVREPLRSHRAPSSSSDAAAGYRHSAAPQRATCSPTTDGARPIPSEPCVHVTATRTATITSSRSDTKSAANDGSVQSDVGTKSVQEPATMSVAVSTVIFSLRAESDHLALWIPLVRRNRAPFAGTWALPGGWVGDSESLSDAARRTLQETTGLRPSYLEQLYTFGHPDRSPASPDGRVVSVVYSALVRTDQAAEAHEDENVRWFCVDDLPELAFDHAEILEYALWRLRNKIEYAHVAFFFLGDTFSLSQLREVYEAILQRRLDPANFRRRVEATGTIVPTEARLTGGRHRPPRLYTTTFVTDPRTTGPSA